MKKQRHNIGTRNFVFLQDKRNGILETQLFIRRTKASSFRTYTVVADNGIGVAKNDVELVWGTSINVLFVIGLLIYVDPITFLYHI